MIGNSFGRYLTVSMLSTVGKSCSSVSNCRVPVSYFYREFFDEINEICMDLHIDI